MLCLNPVKEYILEEGQSFASCHASTLVLLPDKSILAAWFGGSAEGAADVTIWCSRRAEGRWSRPVQVAAQADVPHWNPVLFQSQNSPLYLFFKVGHTIPAWQTWVQTSTDMGYIWSVPRPLVAGDQGGGRGPVKNKPLCLSSGRWLAPASLEGDEWNAFVDISDNQGDSWRKSALVPINRVESPSSLSSLQGKGVIQPTLWESEPGCVHMLLRSTTGYILRSDSQDSGQTWCPAYPTSLPNNNSGIDLTKLQTGELVLVYNPVEENWGKRTPLVLDISRDNGNTWERAYTLEQEAGEYSYPAIVSQGNNIYLTYTWKRERIAFWQMALTP